jgi:GDP-mannose 6-dehydrogenase
MARVSVFGLGYVGCVTAACFARLGNSVVGLDINPAKLDSINAGRSPIVEAEMDQIIAEARAAGRLQAGGSVEAALQESGLSFICVATPSERNGRLNLHSIRQVCQQIGAALRDKTTFHTIVIRSTVLPGTIQSVVIPTLEAESGKKEGHEFAVCMNPEFMREGTAVNDFFHPPFTIVGAERAADAQRVLGLYADIPGEVFSTPVAVAEMVKYTCNAYHALKISFANEIGAFCEQVGVDPYQVMQIFAADKKLNISAAYLSPGFAFGGSCLPKDLRSLNYKAKELDLRLLLLDAIMPSNAEHIERALHTVLQTGKRKIGMLGLSFKAGTDDLRESPAVQLIKRLIGEGCEIKIWDDNVSLGRLMGSNRQFIEEVIPHIGTLLCGDLGEVIGSAEVVVRGTKALERASVAGMLRPEQDFIDLVEGSPLSQEAGI